MALTTEEQELLHKFGHEDRDFSQIEEAMQKTIYPKLPQITANNGKTGG